MSCPIRIIPRLDIKGPNLVKGIHLEGLRVLGRPEEFAVHYYNEGADELIYMDVVASLYDRNSLHDVISRTVEKVFVPITVGGGLRNVDDIRQVLIAGADRVVINTAALNNPDFITQAANKFGSSTIVIAIEASRQPDGKYYAYTDNGRNETGVEVVEWAERVQSLGAGEVLLTAIDNEGAGKGFDRELISQVAGKLNIPLIVHGGASSADDVVALCETRHVDGIACASLFHYEYLMQRENISSCGTEGNVEFQKSGATFSKISAMSVGTLKNKLADRNIYCRLTASCKVV